MNQVQQDELKVEIKDVLKANRGIWMLSYQILARLSEARRMELIVTYGESGRGKGGDTPYSAASYVAQVAAKLVRDRARRTTGRAEKSVISTSNLMVCADPNWMNSQNAQVFVFPGDGIGCAIFRIV